MYAWPKDAHGSRGSRRKRQGAAQGPGREGWGGGVTEQRGMPEPGSRPEGEGGQGRQVVTMDSGGLSGRANSARPEGGRRVGGCWTQHWAVLWNTARGPESSP